MTVVIWDSDTEKPQTLCPLGYDIVRVYIKDHDSDWRLNSMSNSDVYSIRSFRRRGHCKNPWHISFF